MPYWSPIPSAEPPDLPEPPPELLPPPKQTPARDAPPPRDFGAEAKIRAQQRLAVLVTQMRNANPPNVLFEPEAQELRNLCRILGLALTVDRIDLTTGTVERITVKPPTAG